MLKFEITGTDVNDFRHNMRQAVLAMAPTGSKVQIISPEGEVDEFDAGTVATANVAADAPLTAAQAEKVSAKGKATPKASTAPVAPEQSAATKVQREVGSTATVVPPKVDAKETTAEVVEEAAVDEDDDALGETAAPVTVEDVRVLLVELKNNSKEAGILTTVLAPYGTKKLNDVKATDLPALMVDVKARLAKLGA